VHQIVGGFAVFANPKRNAPQLTKVREGKLIELVLSVFNHVDTLSVYGPALFVYSRQYASGRIR
jgi:hypothetical protein